MSILAYLARVKCKNKTPIFFQNRSVAHTLRQFLPKSRRTFNENIYRAINKSPPVGSLRGRNRSPSMRCHRSPSRLVFEFRVESVKRLFSVQVARNRSRSS